MIQPSSRVSGRAARAFDLVAPYEMRAIARVGNWKVRSCWLNDSDFEVSNVERAATPVGFIDHRQADSIPNDTFLDLGLRG